MLEVEYKFNVSLPLNMYEESDTFGSFTLNKTPSTSSNPPLWQSDPGAGNYLPGT